MTLTVKALKKMLDGWPEETEDGEPTEVWVQDSPGVSSEAVDVWPLNRRVDGNGYASYDILITTQE